ncbi:MAG: BrxA/BrxB family bacilliredoxin [Planctomycetes bacterium]|nr:BrxA/BrxB family bacilliredoxin [Planctomycetota bacterium]
MYPEEMVKPMREEVTRLGVRELRTAQDVDTLLKQGKGTAMVFVNSVCGCAAGGARPALALALQHAVKPDALATVFAGADREAVERARSYMAGFPPSSPSIGLFKDGKVVHVVERRQIEGRMPAQIASDLTALFDKHCKPAR